MRADGESVSAVAFTIESGPRVAERFGYAAISGSFRVPEHQSLEEVIS
jgi:hypothetical protein